MQTETGRIIYYLTDFKSRQDQLKDRPYMIFEDMAVVFGILDADRYTVHPIDVRQASYHGWTTDQLWEMAKKNTPRLLPERIEPADKKIIGHTNDEPVFLLSNEVRRYGASVICYEDVLYHFACKYHYNLYLLPTSIHECMVLLDRDSLEYETLLDIVRQSNKTLEREDMLSDNIYYYDRRRREFYGLF
jgi:hypothetical protein